MISEAISSTCASFSVRTFSNWSLERERERGGVEGERERGREGERERGREGERERGREGEREREREREVSIFKVGYKNLLKRMHSFDIIESVHSICRDGAVMPLSLNKCNRSELLNADVLSLFKQTTCSASASIHSNTLKVCKIHSYSDYRNILKTPIVHHHLHLLLLHFKWPTAKLALVIALILSQKPFTLHKFSRCIRVAIHSKNQ